MLSNTSGWARDGTVAETANYSEVVARGPKADEGANVAFAEVFRHVLIDIYKIDSSLTSVVNVRGFVDVYSMLAIVGRYWGIGMRCGGERGWFSCDSEEVRNGVRCAPILESDNGVFVGPSRHTSQYGLPNAEWISIMPACLEVWTCHLPCARNKKPSGPVDGGAGRRTAGYRSLPTHIAAVRHGPTVP